MEEQHANPIDLTAKPEEQTTIGANPQTTPKSCMEGNNASPHTQNGFYKFMNRHHSLFFSLSVVVITLIIGCFLWCSNTNQKTSQNKILEAYRETQRQTESNIELFIKQSNAHRNELQSCVDRQMKLLTQLCNENAKDSLFMAGLFVQLGADIKILEEQNEIITKLSGDSLSRNYEAVMSSVLSEKMLELHLAKIEHEYTNITIWAAVLTIIF